MRKLIVIVALAALAGDAAAADLAEIKARGKLVAATSGNLVPVTYLNEKNELVGYDIEVAKFIEKKLGVPVEINRLDWKGILPGLQTGRFDAVFSNVNITAERKQIFDYSIPYSRSAVVVVARSNVAGVNNFKDLAGRTVGGISGGNDGEIPAREIEQKYGAFKAFKGYPGNAELYQDFAIGRVDAIVTPDTVAALWLAKNPGIGKIAGEPYQVRYVGVPMAKGSTQLKAEVDKAIREMKAQGLLDKWGKEYFSIDGYSKQLVDDVP